MKYPLPTFSEALKQYPLNPVNGKNIDPMVRKVIVFQTAVNDIQCFITQSYSDSQHLGFVYSPYLIGWGKIDIDQILNETEDFEVINHFVFQKNKKFSEYYQALLDFTGENSASNNVSSSVPIDETLEDNYFENPDFCPEELILEQQGRL